MVGVLASVLVGPYISWGRMRHDIAVAASTLGFALGGVAMGIAVGCCSIVGFVRGAESPHVRRGRVCCGIALAGLFVLASPAIAALGVVVIGLPLVWACCVTLPSWLGLRLWKLGQRLQVQCRGRAAPQQHASEHHAQRIAVHKVETLEASELMSSAEDQTPVKCTHIYAITIR
jgi:hypothetical protein